jgi:hypothetical protein
MVPPAGIGRVLEALRSKGFLYDLCTEMYRPMYQLTTPYGGTEASVYT